MITGNKGEWSEAYVLLKLLGDTKIHVGDEDLNRIEGLFYPIVKILREEAAKNTEYVLEGDIVLVGDGLFERRIPTSEFIFQAKQLLERIKSSKGSSFSVEESERFLDSIGCTSLKSKSTNKTDINIVVHDPRTNSTPLLGFSIKSRLGSPATLLNASRATNFRYSLGDVEQELAEQFNRIDSFHEKFELLKNHGIEPTFLGLENSIFENNLILVDSGLPVILSRILIGYYASKESELRDLTQRVSRDNPLKYDQSFQHNFYEYKIKRFLTDIALGMMPSKVWKGEYQANGGYLVVKEDGEVLCYHIYNKSQFENYLFVNTRLDTPSTSRHKFGTIYYEGEEAFLNLNLQIRFR